MRPMSATVISLGTFVRLPPNATADGARVSHPPSPVGMWLSPSHGLLALALRPAWAIWMPATAPFALRNLAILANGSTCASW